jgi:hypothetical protein
MYDCYIEYGSLQYVGRTNWGRRFVVFVVWAVGVIFILFPGVFYVGGDEGL